MHNYTLYDKNTATEAVIARPDLTAAQVLHFCRKNNLQFHAMGCPAGAGGTGWDDPTVFRVATNEFPARGVTIALDTVVEWSRALDGIGARVTTGGSYRHYKGGSYTTVCEATDKSTGIRQMVYQDSDDIVWVRPWDEFFAVVKDDAGRLVARFVLVHDSKSVVTEGAA